MSANGLLQPKCAAKINIYFETNKFLPVFFHFYRKKLRNRHDHLSLSFLYISYNHNSRSAIFADNHLIDRQIYFPLHIRCNSPSQESDQRWGFPLSAGNTFPAFHIRSNYPLISLIRCNQLRKRFISLIKSNQLRKRKNQATLAEIDGNRRIASVLQKRIS